VSDAIEIYLELIQLLKNLGISSNFCVGAADDSISFIILQLGKSLRFMTQVINPLFDTSHKMIKVTA
jgi:hypothetical protein